MILGYCKIRRTNLSLDVFEMMVNGKRMPNQTRYTIIIEGIAHEEELELAKEVLEELQLLRKVVGLMGSRRWVHEAIYTLCSFVRMMTYVCFSYNIAEINKKQETRCWCIHWHIKDPIKFYKKSKMLITRRSLYIYLTRNLNKSLIM